MSLNYFLLSTFATNTTVGSDIVSIQKRYRSLSIICLSLLQIIICYGYVFYDTFFAPLPGATVARIIPPLLILTLVLLRAGHNIGATVLFLCTFHLGALLSGVLSGVSLGALISLSLMPSIGFLITSSSRLHKLNFILCVAQNFLHIIQLNLIFDTLTEEEQRNQIFTAQLYGSCTILTHWMHNYLTKHIESQLLQHVETNYEKAANITRELVQALSSKDLFMTSLSHEAHNLLDCLTGNINHLLAIVNDSSGRKIIKEAKLNCEVLLNLVNNVLDINRPRSGNTESENPEMDPIETMKKALSINTENLRKKDIFVKAFVYKDIPSLVRLDSGRFLQILMNLMSNAIKFTEKKGEIKLYMKWYSAKTSLMILKQPIDTNSLNMNIQNGLKTTNTSSIPPFSSASEILEEMSKEFGFSEAKNRQRQLDYLKGLNAKTLGQVNCITGSDTDSVPWTITQRDCLPNLNFQRNGVSLNDDVPSRALHGKRGFIKVQISDEGCGIPNDILPKLFGMFTQSQSAMVDRNGVTGFGLWISKYLCHKMGGDITVYTKENQGTTFVFYIPVDIGSYMGNPQRAFNPSKQVHALVVDDFAFIRNLHKLLLEREGVQVTLASDGADAIKEYMKYPDGGHFDFIMMDVQMPGMDGITAVKKIREFENENELALADIYMVSGEYYDEREMLMEIKRGLKSSEPSQVRCLRKPIDVDLVRKIVEDFNKLKRENV